MSMKVLVSLVGEDRVAALEPDEVRHLCNAIDVEILKDAALTARLLAAVQDAANKLPRGPRPNTLVKSQGNELL